MTNQEAAERLKKHKADLQLRWNSVLGPALDAAISALEARDSLELSRRAFVNNQFWQEIERGAK